MKPGSDLLLKLRIANVKMDCSDGLVVLDGKVVSTHMCPFVKLVVITQYLKSLQHLPVL